MDTSTPDGARPHYEKDDAFDLKRGMPVHGPGGEKIGVVSDIAGFGATRLGAVVSGERDHRLTQAQSGTGYFKVSRDETLGNSETELCIPFHTIQSISAEHGVVLSSMVVSEQQKSVRPTGSTTVETPAASGPRWHRWLPGRKS